MVMHSEGYGEATRKPESGSGETKYDAQTIWCKLILQYVCSKTNVY